MKVFKERKAGLLFRRGLVALSILALAFTFGACGNGGGTTYIEVPGPTPPAPPPELIPVQGSFVTNVTLLNVADIQRTVGWQGLPLDLTGAVLDVTWSDPPTTENGSRPTRREVIQLGAANMDGWGTDPIAPDLHWHTVYTRTVEGSVAVEDVGPRAVFALDATGFETFEPQSFRIVHRSNAGAQSAPFRINNVIPLIQLAVEIPSSFVWFTDRRPENIDEFRVTGTWQYEVFSTDPAHHANIPLASRGDFVVNHEGFGHALNVTSWNLATGTNYQITVNGNTVGNEDTRLDIGDGILLRERSRQIPINDGYPVLNFQNVVHEPTPFIEVVIGSTHPNWEPTWGPGGTPDTRETNLQGGRFVRQPITAFLEPRGIRFADNQPSPNWFLRDDQFVNITDLDEMTIQLLAFLMANNPNFVVYYESPVTGVITRNMDFVEFLANVQFHLEMTGQGGIDQEEWIERFANTVVTGFGTRRPSTRHLRDRDIEVPELGPVNAPRQLTGLLINQGVGDQAPFWTITVEYVGSRFGGEHAFEDGTFAVAANAEVPLYSFDSFASPAVTRRGVTPNLQINQQITGFLPPALAGPLTDYDGAIWDSANYVSGLIPGINARWYLHGIYTRGGATRTLQIPFNADMFWPVTAQGNLGDNDIANAQNYSYFPAWPLDFWGTRSIVRQPLAIDWRGASTRGTRDEMLGGGSVVIEVRGAEPNHNHANFDPPAGRGYIRTIDVRVPHVVSLETTAPGDDLSGAFITANTAEGGMVIGQIREFDRVYVTNARFLEEDEAFAFAQSFITAAARLDELDPTHAAFNNDLRVLEVTVVASPADLTTFSYRLASGTNIGTGEPGIRLLPPISGTGLGTGVLVTAGRVGGGYRITSNTTPGGNLATWGLMNPATPGELTFRVTINQAAARTAGWVPLPVVP